MRIAFYTLGCKVNQCETQALTQRFSAEGYDVVSHEAQSDVYVINSCTVTAEGDRKTRQMLRRFKKLNPASCVALTGCFPQAFPDAAAKLPEADILCGNRRREALVALVAQFLRTGERIVAITPHEKDEPFESGDAQYTGERTRTFLKIQDGCRRYCAYCIIPAARGPLRSKSPQEITAAVQAAAAAGCNEAVLTGINLSCYGKEQGLRLTDALEAACRTSICRVRLGSLEPELLEPDDIARMASQEKLCPQFHMSLQSGCDETLRRMRRQYTAEGYAEIVRDLRKFFPGCAVTTDIMVGFPGETEAEFAASLAFATEIGFAKAHVFAYSRRPGTKAADMPGQIQNAVKSRRAAEMAAAMQRSAQAYLQAQQGRRLNVLFEAKSGEYWEGYAENYVPVRAKSNDYLHGVMLPITVQTVENDTCMGEIGK